jgi:hypothetical protein
MLQNAKGVAFTTIIKQLSASYLALNNKLGLQWEDEL